MITLTKYELTPADRAEIELAEEDRKFCRKYGTDPARWTRRQQQAWARKAAKVRADFGFGRELGDAA